MNEPSSAPTRNGKKRRRSRRSKTAVDKLGVAPGTLLADPEAPKPIMSLIAYGPEGFKEEKVASLDQIPPFTQKFPVTWLNVDGLGDATLIAAIGEMFGLHRLALEDVLHVHQRPKVEHFGSYTFIVTRLAELNPQLSIEQVSMFVSQNVVITFQEDQIDSLISIRERIMHGRGRLRTSGTDYLAYCILDFAVDSYFPVLEDYGERLDSLEETILDSSSASVVSDIHSAKRDLLAIRRAIWPQRDALNILVRDELPLFSSETRFYLRDCYDHVVRIIDLVEMYRELGADLMDLSMSVVSNRSNEIMRVLTIIATIFMPLTFVAGLYGMNFDTAASPLNMPELRWYFGYPFALGIMILSAAALMTYFYKKGWLSSPKRH